MKSNNPAGRPRKGTDRQTVMVRIEKRHIELLRIYAEQRRCLDPMSSCMIVPIPEPKTGHARMKELRDSLGKIIEAACTVNALWPVNIEVRGAVFGSVDESRAVIDWMAEQEIKLTAEAPGATGSAFAVNKAIRRGLELKGTRSIFEARDEIKNIWRDLLVEVLKRKPQDAVDGGPETT